MFDIRQSWQFRRKGSTLRRLLHYGVCVKRHLQFLIEVHRGSAFIRDLGICDGDDPAHVRQDRFLHVHLIRIRPCFQHKDTLQLVAVVHDDGHALRLTGA